jgi:hypothetical protein
MPTRSVLISLVLKALPAVYRVEYSARAHERNLEDGIAVGTLPRLFFSCTLRDIYAICHAR